MPNPPCSTALHPPPPPPLPAAPPAPDRPAPPPPPARSALAGAVARFVVGPLDVLKIRFQVQLEPIAAGVKASHYTSMRQALVTIVQEEGIKARGGVAIAAWLPVLWIAELAGKRHGRSAALPLLQLRGLHPAAPAGQAAVALAIHRPRPVVSRPPSPPAPCRACGAAPCPASC